MMKLAAYASLTLILAMPTWVRADTLIYDNSKYLIWPWLSVPSEGEFGDGATLAGSERLVTKLSLVIDSGSGDITADVRVRLFEGGDGFSGEPGAMLWESELFERMPILDGFRFYDFVVPRVEVPDSLTWTLQLLNADPPEAIRGPHYADPPVIGSSNDHFWQRDRDGTWQRHWSHLLRSFGAKIEAVPEPATLSLLGLGGIALAARRRVR